LRQFQRDALKSDIAGSATDGSEDCPLFPVQHYFGPDLSLWKRGVDSRPLVSRSEGLLTKAVSKQAAERRFSRAVADGRVAISRIR
jgi:hypothetical protein